MYTGDLSRVPAWEEAPWLNAIGEILEDKVGKRTAGGDGLPAEDRGWVAWCISVGWHWSR